MKKIYHIAPIYKSFIWGGRKLIERFQLETELENVGTIYNVIAIPGDLDNMVLETKEPLSQFYKKNPALFCCEEEIFPVRMTITCNEGKQSYHLHPDDAYALAHEGTKGKKSGAVAVDAENGGKKCYFGNKAKSLEEFKTLVENKDWENLFQMMETGPGDYLHTPAGLIHGGNGAGAVMVTFSTNSDITYRFYDYDRNEPGRHLHLQQVYDCVNIPEVAAGPVHVEPVQKDGVLLYEYYSAPGEYVAGRIKAEGGSGAYECPEFVFMTCVGGEGSIGGELVKPGETLFVPANMGRISIEGAMDIMLLSYK